MLMKDYMTASQAIELEKTGHHIHIRPRRRELIIDGYKIYRCNDCTISTIKYWRKTGFEVKR